MVGRESVVGPAEALVGPGWLRLRLPGVELDAGVEDAARAALQDRVRDTGADDHAGEECSHHRDAAAGTTTVTEHGAIMLPSV